MFPGEVVYIDPKTGGCIRTFPFKRGLEKKYAKFEESCGNELAKLGEKREAAEEKFYKKHRNFVVEYC
jgi:hypothetical protein